MKKLITFGIITVALLAGGIAFLSRGETTPQVQSQNTTAYEYFWGEGCTHCQKVAEFFDTWDKKDKVVIDKKEVFGNQINQLLLTKRAKSCNINQNEIGVPFLYTPDGKCLTGDQPIIEYFQNLSL